MTWLSSHSALAAPGDWVAAAASRVPGVIPSPDVSVWHLGPLPIRAYAICIMAGIAAAIAIAYYRLRARGGTGQEIYDVAVWAVVLGILGGRIYHVITTPGPYFGDGGDPWAAIRIWDGGLGIWGAIALGAVGVWIGAKQYGHRFADLADAIAPGLLVAQALGRWGNWFNNELYGGADDGPLALRIYEFNMSAGRAVTDADGNPVVLGTFQPTFLYESLWCLLMAVVIMLADRRIRFARGQVFALYVMAYTAGRLVIELMRTDPATIVWGQRINVWVAIGVFLLGLGLYLWRGAVADYPTRGPAPVSAPTGGDEGSADSVEETAKGTADQAASDAAGEASDAAPAADGSHRS